MWPISASACCFWPDPSACSSTSVIPRRLSPVESSAPQATRLSSIRRLSTLPSTRSQNSQIDVNGPSSRAVMIWRTAPSPTFLTADKPNRIRPSTTAKSDMLELTSGGSTSMPISAHSDT
jgi:hypothetical protein